MEQNPSFSTCSKNLRKFLRNSLIKIQEKKTVNEKNIEVLRKF